MALPISRLAPKNRGEATEVTADLASIWPRVVAYAIEHRSVTPQELHNKFGKLIRPYSLQEFTAECRAFGLGKIIGKSKKDAAKDVTDSLIEANKRRGEIHLERMHQRLEIVSSAMDVEADELKKITEAEDKTGLSKGISVVLDHGAQAHKLARDVYGMNEKADQRAAILKALIGSTPVQDAGQFLFEMDEDEDDD